MDPKNDIQGIIESIKATFADFGLQVLSAIGIIIVGFWLAKKIASLAQRGFKRVELDETLRRFFKNIIYYAMIIFVIIAALGAIGINTNSFLAVLGAAGLAVGLAMEGSLSNFAAGVNIILFRPLRVEDWVEVDENFGRVDKLGMLHTILVTLDNETIIIPNTEITGNIFTNYSTQGWVRVELPLMVSHNADFKAVKALMFDSVEQAKMLLKEPAPEVQILDIDEKGLKLQLEVTVEPKDREDALFELADIVKTALDREGIEMPHRYLDVKLHQES